MNIIVRRETEETTAEAVQHLIDLLTDDERRAMCGVPGEPYLANDEKDDLIVRLVAYNEAADNEAAGFLDVFHVEERRANVTLAVHPRYQRKGVATKLVEEMLNWFQEKSTPIEVITWFARLDNPASLRLTEQNRFVLMEDYVRDPEWWGGILVK